MKTLAALLLLLTVPLTAQGSTRGGPISPDGKTMVQTWLPLELRIFNTGGSDGKGLCVYTSVTMAALHQNESKLFGLRKYAESRPGGSWPTKLAGDIAAVAPDLEWINYEGLGKDASLLRAALASGRMVSVAIPGHMLNLVHLDDNYACWMDNNAVYDRQTKADNQLVWMTPQEFLSKWTGWAVILLHPGPPPVAGQVAASELPEAPSWQPALRHWRVYADNPTQVFLQQAGVTVGGWDYAKQFWQEKFTDGSWGPRLYGQPAAPVPAAIPAPGVSEVLDCGCWYVPPGEERYWLNGQQVSKAQVFESLAEQCPNCPGPKNPRPKTPTPPIGPKSPVIPDDGGKLHLTIIGDAAHQVAKDWASAPELAPFRAKVLFQDYAENDPALAAAGLPVTGFHVLIQLPNSGQFPGKIVVNFTSYSGPAALASALAKFDPSSPPSPPTPPTPPSGPTDPSNPEQPAAPPEQEDLLTLVLGLITVLAGGARQTTSTSTQEPQK